MVMENDGAVLAGTLDSLELQPTAASDANVATATSDTMRAVTMHSNIAVGPDVADVG
jgi:hypothetical protein